ncbi:MAG TPA: sterol desaturase family protein [Acidimicrobiia bacterium]|jgi:sterol desaturase/sphingolipid hydroxylase (fatty acid hydroxylase superfamily)|nr:sterol desaturase family protein [Acidimicrobiia bacterium]
MQRHLDSLPAAATVALFTSVAVMIAVEMIVDRVRRRRIDVRDSANSMAIGLGYLGVKVVAGKVLGFALFLYLYDNFRFFTLDIHNPLHWIAAWMVGDFVYYWIHRAEHRVRVLWCTHLVHHSSREFSFTTAVRMPWTEVLYKPLTGLWAPLLGVHPAMGAVMGAIALMLGQLQHTKLIGKLGPLDKILTTPSNHRVHHASNREYLDRNFGGSTMIWDRLFGTYAAEEATPVYGLTHNLTARTPLGIVAGGYPELAQELAATPGVRNRLQLCTGRP